MPPSQPQYPSNYTGSTVAKADSQPIQQYPYRNPVSKSKTKKAMLIIVLFMIIGSLFMAVISYALSRASSIIKQSQTIPENRVSQPVKRRVR